MPEHRLVSLFRAAVSKIIKGCLGLNIVEDIANKYFFNDLAVAVLKSRNSFCRGKIIKAKFISNRDDFI